MGIIDLLLSMSQCGFVGPKLHIVASNWEACNGQGRLTVVNASGRKKMLTNVSNLTFSPSLVDALLSMTALALNSYPLSA